MNETHPVTAARLSRKKGCRLATTTGEGKNGAPPVTPSGAMTRAGDGTTEPTCRFCPLTMENPGLNPRCSIVVWDDASNTGFQVPGA